ncbi:hypothetical protein AB0A91_09225 [Streptomyces sp. NPDC042207]|uniref:hypothetical protein n=1 Tax=Streptomyces sp. NPDC042207 TaxID=3154331 RepID=UPI0033E36D8A
MNKWRVRKVLEQVRQGQRVELRLSKSSVAKAAGLACLAEQFGYEYVHAERVRDNKMLLVLAPDPSPQARARAAENWARYPNAADGVSLPPLVPAAFEVMTARINVDMSGAGDQIAMALVGVIATFGCAYCAVQASGDGLFLLVIGVLWVCFLVASAGGFLFLRRRHARAVALLQAAGFVPVTEERGRVRYRPGPAWQAGPYGQGPYGQGVYGQGPYGQGPYSQGPYGQGPYGNGPRPPQ